MKEINNLPIYLACYRFRSTFYINTLRKKFIQQNFFCCPDKMFCWNNKRILLIWQNCFLSVNLTKRKYLYVYVLCKELSWWLDAWIGYKNPQFKRFLEYELYMQSLFWQTKPFHVTTQTIFISYSQSFYGPLLKLVFLA